MQDTDSDEPLQVSVIVPTYEDVEFVDSALDSIADQTYSNVETIVVDSSGADWLRDRCDRDDSLTYVYQEPDGVSAARNRGIAEASGDVVAFLDADDFYAPENLTEQVRSIEGGADVVYTDVYEVDPSGGGDPELRESFPVRDRERHHVDFFRHDGVAGNIATSAIAVRSSLLGDCPFDEDLDGGEDYHLWVRLFAEGSVEHVRKPYVYVRMREDSLSSDAEMMYHNRVEAVEKLAAEYPELAEFADERKRLERYNYARESLKRGRTAEARGTFLKLITDADYYRAAILLPLTVLPCCHERAIETLDALYSRVS